MDAVPTIKITKAAIRAVMVSGQIQASTMATVRKNPVKKTARVNEPVAMSDTRTC